MNESMETNDNSTTEQPKQGIRWTTIVMWAVVLGVLGLLGWGLINSTAPRPEVGQPAPDFKIEFFEGYEWDGRSTAKLSEMQGNVVVINFWASWCVECRYEAEVLENAASKYADDGVVFLGVAYADVEPNSLAYMQEFNVSYPHAPDLGTDISQMYEITGVPETFVVGPDGVIEYFQLAPIDEATLDGVISQILAEGG
ncbi:MAG: TlpA family protein disulfide reductase [Chloroflexi bacterium]|nr:TlpA family protein disulfide reductase [Chloroflexota bacterium]